MHIPLGQEKRNGEGKAQSKTKAILKNNFAKNFINPKNPPQFLQEEKNYQRKIKQEHECFAR